MPPQRFVRYAVVTAVGLFFSANVALAGPAAAAAQQQAAMMAAANAAVRQQACLQWLPVINDQRYDPAMRTQALQIVASCGIPVPYVALAGPRY